MSDWLIGLTPYSDPLTGPVGPLLFRHLDCQTLRIILITALWQMVELMAALLIRFLEMLVHRSLGLTAAADCVIQTQRKTRNRGIHLLKTFGPRSGQIVTGRLRAGRRCAEQLLQQ